MNENQTNKNANLFAVGFTGLLLGIAATTTLALSDEEVRKRANKRAKNILTLLQKWGKERLSTLQEKKEMLSQTADDTLPTEEHL